MPSFPDQHRRRAVLVVFPFCCDRVGHGNIQRTLAIATFLARHEVDIDLLYQGNPKVPSREAEFARSFRRVLRVDAWQSSSHADVVMEREAFYAAHEPPPPNLTPGTALTVAARGLLDALPYDAVLSSYAWTAPIYEPLARRALRIVDLHDIVSLHAQRQMQATAAPAVYAIAEATERHLWTKWDVLLAITPEEAALVAAHRRPSQRVLTIPHAMPTVDAPDGDPDVFVYIGSDNAANRHAVTWLLTRVWPGVATARPRARLRLAGLICDAVRATPLVGTPGLELAGFVDRPMEVLTAGAISVAPYLFGSGLKIKIVEAAAAGRAIVTTSIGAEGTGMRGGEHLLVADDEETFAAAMLKLLDDAVERRRLMQAARTHASRAFSAHNCYHPLLDLVRAHELVPES